MVWSTKVQFVLLRYVVDVARLLLKRSHNVAAETLSGRGIFVIGVRWSVRFRVGAVVVGMPVCVAVKKNERMLIANT